MNNDKRSKDPRPMKCVWRNSNGVPKENGELSRELPNPCKDRGCKGQFTSKRKALRWKMAHEKCCFTEDIMTDVGERE